MARFDLTAPTPAPVIAPDYSRLINIRRTADLKADPNLGPFSSLIDYPAEEEIIKADKEKKQAIQQKIMRTNAIGEAFRLLIEGAGAFGGATITPRSVNPLVLNAVNEYGKTDTEYMQRLQGLKTTKMALKKADLDLAAAQAERGHEDIKQERAQAFTKEMEDIQYGHKAELEAQQLINQYKLLKEKAEIDGDAEKADFYRKKELLAEQAKQGIIEYTGKKEADMKVYTSGPSTVRHSKDDLAVKSTETGVTHYFRPEEVRQANYLLQQGLTRFNQQIPKNVRLMLDGKKYEEEGLAIELQNNWPLVKYVLPEFAAGLQQAQFENMQQGGTGALIPGVPTGQQAGQQAPPQSQGKVAELPGEVHDQLMADLEGIVNSNYTPTTKRNKMTSKIIQTYLANGISKSYTWAAQQVDNLIAENEQNKKQAVTK